jgi:hypothetical protein
MSRIQKISPQNPIIFGLVLIALTPAGCGKLGNSDLVPASATAPSPSLSSSTTLVEPDNKGSSVAEALTSTPPKAVTEPLSAPATDSNQSSGVEFHPGIPFVISKDFDPNAPLYAYYSATPGHVELPTTSHFWCTLRLALSNNPNACDSGTFVRTPDSAVQIDVQYAMNANSLWFRTEECALFDYSLPSSTVFSISTHPVQPHDPNSVGCPVLAGQFLADGQLFFNSKDFSEASGTLSGDLQQFPNCRLITLNESGATHLSYVFSAKPCQFPNSGL